MDHDQRRESPDQPEAKGIRSKGWGCKCRERRRQRRSLAPCKHEARKPLQPRGNPTNAAPRAALIYRECVGTAVIPRTSTALWPLPEMHLPRSSLGPTRAFNKHNLYLFFYLNPLFCGSSFSHGPFSRFFISQFYCYHVSVWVFLRFNHFFVLDRTGLQYYTLSYL